LNLKKIYIWLYSVSQRRRRKRVKRRKPVIPVLKYERCKVVPNSATGLRSESNCSVEVLILRAVD
jgi:hypothetical protein